MATVSPQRPWSYTLELPHEPHAPAIARVTLRSVLGRHGMAKVAETAELLACELVTNAYVHTNGRCSLRLQGWEDGRLRVSVWDTNPHVPPQFGPEESAPQVHDPDSEAGRGLLLLRLCADNWGGYAYDRHVFGPCGGKTLWFELAPRTAAARYGVTV
ncbi:ATP-binding protein [Streptomyces sp. NPDC049577]|uniref:ATP-binding protein n=1 Tax=Streptomyces sp. NPDC049577 TaxID=3155153 RepID=UPI00341AF0D3